MPYINCAAGAKNGTAVSRITLQAENERQAFISGDGSLSPFQLQNCSYWTIEGLRTNSADSNGASNDASINVVNANHVTFRRLLVTHSNRYVNSHLMLLYQSQNILIEESEFYYFHRHAIAITATTNSVLRGNYANSRGYTDILRIPLCSMSPEFLNLLKRGHENASPGTHANPLLASMCA
jgi:hypothetical protein